MKPVLKDGMVQVLDFGYVKLVEKWGSDQSIIEAARMSTDKGFEGWGPKPCPWCSAATLVFGRGCEKCKHTGQVEGDEKLLRYLYKNKHTTPFEMAGFTIQVQAPILVFREWHRHRTQSYSEMSARYVPLPDVNYRPTRERIIDGAKAAGNRQAEGVMPLRVEAIDDWLKAVDAAYDGIEQTYQTGLAIGIPKEVARVVLPVGRYSCMRASTDLHNWLKFLLLRLAPNAQWEIRQYARVIGDIIAVSYPRTWALFLAGHPELFV